LFCNFLIHFIKEEKFRIFENLFNEKLKVLETANDYLKTEITNVKKEIFIVKTENNNLKIDNNNLKIDNNNLKIENNNLKSRIDILETYDIPLSLVRGSKESNYTLTNDSVLFNVNNWCSVFLNRIIEKVSFFFCFFMIICSRVFIIGLFIGLFIYYFFFSKSGFSFTPDSSHWSEFGIVDSNKIKECFNTHICYKNSFFFFSFFIIFYFISFLIGLCLEFKIYDCCYYRLCNNSTTKDLPSLRFPSATRVALQVNMDDNTLHFFRNGMFFINSIIII
jgi:hypothetical protein